MHKSVESAETKNIRISSLGMSLRVMRTMEEYMPKSMITDVR
jgi:hypothetical protein